MTVTAVRRTSRNLRQKSAAAQFTNCYPKREGVIAMAMSRHITNYDISWFLETARNNQLDLDPPYQRRSVWTKRDKQFFLDTIFRNYPSPAIFLHKALDDNGRPTFHVVDGKQRIQTILDFTTNKIRIGDDYGDTRLASRDWSDLRAEPEIRKLFWDYRFVVEELSFDDPRVVNDIFDRINRNARKLTRQELRHAKYEGWFINHVEREADQPDWKTLGIVTQARERRMADSQFLSELMLVTLERRIRGFDQDALDQAYADYDDISTQDSTVNEEEFLTSYNRTKAYFLTLEQTNHGVTKYCRALNNFYTLWSVLSLEPDLGDLVDFSDRFDDFMALVAGYVSESAPDRDSSLYGLVDELKTAIRKYAENQRGANTDIGPRQARFDAMVQGLRLVR